MRVFFVAFVALAGIITAAAQAPTSAPSVATNAPTAAATTALELTQLVMVGVNSVLMVVLVLLLLVTIALIAVVLALVAKKMGRPPSNDAAPLPAAEANASAVANVAADAAEAADGDMDRALSDAGSSAGEEDATDAVNPLFRLGAAKATPSEAKVEIMANVMATAELEMVARNGAAAASVDPDDASRPHGREGAAPQRARRRRSTASARTVAARERVRERRASFADQRARQASDYSERADASLREAATPSRLSEY